MDEIKEAKLYTIPELCEILGYERHTIYGLIASGRLKAIKTKEKAHRRVFGKYLLEFLNS